MNILIAYSSKQLGPDAFISELVQQCKKLNEVVAIDVSKENTGNGDAAEYDIILVIDATEWYIKNKLKLKGRPWVCVMSFSFESLIPFLSVVASDLGVHAMICNSGAFVAKCSAMLPTMFHWKPVPQSSLVGTHTTIGSVLPNVMDRDFCLIAYVYGFMHSRGIPFKLFMAPGALESRLPQELEGIQIETFTDEIEVYKTLSYYVPAPRITDYRVGVIPPEMIKAMAYGCKPLSMWHPSLGTIKEVVNPLFDSFDRFKGVLADIAKNPANREHVIVDLPSAFAPKTQDLISTVLSMHQRWKANAITRR